MSSVDELVQDLDLGDRAAAHHGIAQRLGARGPETMLAELRSSLPDAIDVGRSVEKTTHYKWFLSATPNADFEVWLHEYKPSELRREGHATVPHNHRFWLTSLILRGGFSDTRYTRAAADPGGSSIEAIAHRSLRPGDTMVIDPNEIHSLSKLLDGTLSMVVQSRAVRSYSEVFEDGQVRRYSDLEAKRAALRESL